jgi:hypothetical protein
MTEPIDDNPTACSGYCRDCGREHHLPPGNARSHALGVIRELERLQRIDYLAPDSAADPRLSFEQLFPGEPGNMFGVLECLDPQGGTVVLRAFSSLRRGIREVAGWVPAILSTEVFYGLVEPAQQQIERLTTRLETLDPRASAYRAIARERRERSRRLLDAMQASYRFHNFRGQSRPLRDAFYGPGGIPGGVGECCAPKLLNHAARNGLRPIGLAEFYWGGSKGSRTLKHGEFYPSCESRCQPILGFMLCGLADDG